MARIDDNVCGQVRTRVANGKSCRCRGVTPPRYELTRHIRSPREGAEVSAMLSYVVSDEAYSVARSCRGPEVRTGEGCMVACEAAEVSTMLAHEMTRRTRLRAQKSSLPRSPR